MELKEAIGLRRSVRYLNPERPVERAKIQKMLEAARRASHWGNVHTLRAVVIERAAASPEALDNLDAWVGGYQAKLARPRRPGLAWQRRSRCDGPVGQGGAGRLYPPGDSHRVQRGVGTDAVRQTVI